MILIMKNLSHVSLVFVYGFLALEQVLVSVLGNGFSLYLLQVGLGKVREGALVWGLIGNLNGFSVSG